MHHPRKGFVELALERRLITAASLLDDSPAQITTVAGVYLPQNYDKQYRGWVSARAVKENFNPPTSFAYPFMGDA